MLEQLVRKYPDLKPCLAEIQRIFEVLSACYRRGGKVLICGNGGSAADSEHLVGELMKGYLTSRPIPEEARERLVAAFPEEGAYLADHLQGALPTLSLVSQTALITAYANDVAADMIFAQQVYGYGNEGDALLGISTSGTSRNVLHALRVAHVRGMHTIGITGRSGGAMAALCEVTLRVPRDKTADIQERHLAIYHALCAMLEQEFFP
ncbi:MAG: SIS domain-containing protein [Chloroflexota bacterium]|nr:SIS domain-containing protein [Chloroflexota bacterium]